MKDIYKTKLETLQEIIKAFEIYNGKPKNLSYDGVKRYILNAIANSRRIFIQPEDSIEEKFKSFEDLD